MRQCIADHPAIDGGHQPVALGRRQEGAGQHHATVLVAQPQQQFDAGGGVAAIQRHDLLVVQQQAVLLDGPAQPARPFHLALAPRGLVVLAVHVHTVAAVLLGQVAGGVRPGQQVLQRGLLLVHHHHADAGADGVGAVLPDEHQRLDALAQAFGQRARALGIHVEGHQAEFVAAQARQHVATAQLLAHGQRQLRQQLVAGHVAGHVVDQLELVQVDVQQCAGIARHAALALAEGFLDATLELAAVAQLGQRVVGRLVAEAFGQLALFGDVRGDHQQVRPSLHVDVRDRGAGPEGFAAGAEQHGFQVAPVVADGVGVAGAVLQLRIGEQRRQRQSGRVAQAQARRLVGVDDAAVARIGQQDQRGQQFVEGAEAQFAFAIALAHLFAQRLGPSPGAGQRPRQRGQQQADGAAPGQQGLQPAQFQRLRARQHLDAPLPAADVQAALLHGDAGGCGRGGIVERVRAGGGVVDAHAEAVQHRARQGRFHQRLQADADGQRADLAGAPLVGRGRGGAIGIHRQAQGDAQRVLPAGYRLLQRERRGNDHGVGIARAQQGGQVGLLRHHVEADQRRVGFVGGDEFVAVGHLIGQRLARGRAARERHRGVGGRGQRAAQAGVVLAEARLVHLVVGQEHGLHGAQHQGRLLQRHPQARGACVGQFAPGFLGAFLQVAPLAMGHHRGARQAQQQHHRRPRQRRHPRARRGQALRRGGVGDRGGGVHLRGILLRERRSAPMGWTNGGMQASCQARRIEASPCVWRFAGAGRASCVSIGPRGSFLTRVTVPSTRR